MTKIDMSPNQFQDIESKTGSVSFAMAPFAIGIQRTKTDGVGDVTLTANTNHEDITDLVSATYAVTKDLTAGVAYSTMERTRNSVASPTDAKLMTLSLAYTMGPVVLSYDYEKASDSAVDALSNNVAGNDTTANKLKAKVNF
jgi:predicted porin